MIRNYLKIALRTLWRQKGYTVLNVCGLALGMGCAILIFLSVQYDISFDRFHDDSDRIFRVLSIDRALGVTANNVGVTIPALGPALEAELPEVELSVRLQNAGRNLLSYEDRAFYADDVLFAEAEFFDLFDFDLIAGDPAHVLTQPMTTVLTRSMARRLFGDEMAALGKAIRANNEEEYEITGIVADPPQNSHLRFDAVASLAPAEDQEQFQEFLQTWNAIALMTYVRLTDAAAVEGMDERIEEILRRNEAPEAWSATLQPLHDIHLRSSNVIFDTNEGKSDIGYVYGLSAFALFILVIAILNFINLATARAAERAREVGVRKVVGAGKPQLIAQHLGESFMITSVAFVLAVAGVISLIAVAGDVFGREMSADMLVDPQLLIYMTMLAGGVALAAGAYPAFVLSSFQPIGVLKGAFRTSRQGEALRRSLVVVQFAAAIVMIVGALVVSQQLGYIMGKNLGYDREQVVVLDLDNQELQERATTLSEELERSAQVASTSRASTVPGRGLGRVGIVPEGAQEGESWIVSVLSIDEQYLNTLGMMLAAGRNFSDEFGSDTEQALLINEAAARTLGWDDPIGRRITASETEREVVGVVRDFHFANMRHAIEPIIFLYNVGSLPTLAVRMEGRDASVALDQIEQAWAHVNPDYPFEYSFLDAEFAQLYAQEALFARLANGFTLLSILIACLGMFGLAAFTTQQRTREIGVRKVLGATVPQIMTLLSKDFARLVVIAFLVAAPVGYLLMTRWLEDFAYRIELGPVIFAIAGLLALAIALSTVSYHAMRAAYIDPARSLRYE